MQKVFMIRSISDLATAIGGEENIMGQLRMSELRPEQVCPRCRALCPDGHLAISGSSGLVALGAQMWTPNTAEDSLFHATITIQPNNPANETRMVVLCKIQEP